MSLFHFLICVLEPLILSFHVMVEREVAGKLSQEV